MKLVPRTTFGRIPTAMIVGALLVSMISFVSPAVAETSKCDRTQVDISRAKQIKIVPLDGMSRTRAKALVRLRKQGKITQLEDLRIADINDIRFLKLVSDSRTCFAGRDASELFPDAICASDNVRINTSKPRALAKQIGLRNARLLIAARPIESLEDIASIPGRGKKILSRVARSGDTCLDPIAADVATSMDAGTFLVGTDMVPGRYIATDVDDCYWERGSANKSKASAIIASGTSSNALQVVTDIAATDTSFTSAGCGTWVEVRDATLSPLDEVPGDGDWLIGTQVAPGIYRSLNATDCSWARQLGLSGEPTDTIETSQLPGEHTLVEVRSTDIAFTSSGCGAWELVLSECLNQLEAVHPAIPEVKPHIYGVSDSVLLSTQWEMEMVMEDFTFNWGGFGGLNTRDAPPIIEIEIGEGKVTGSTVIVGLGHNYRSEMLAEFPGYIDSLLETFPSHVDRMIWVLPSRFNTLVPAAVTMLDDATERWPELEIADFWIEGDAQSHPEWFQDELHHNAVGRQQISEYLNDKLLNPCG